MLKNMCSTAASINPADLRRRLRALCTAPPGADAYRAADNAIAGHCRTGDADSTAHRHADPRANRYTAPE
jgi:hypothetical protein